MASQTHLSNFIDERCSYFPPVRRQLSLDPNLFEGLKLTCVICRQEMNIVGDGFPESDHRSDGFAATHGVTSARELRRRRPQPSKESTAIVVPCGHIFCRGCLYALCWEGFDVNDFVPGNEQAKSDPACPMCKQSLCFENCVFRCRYPGIPFPRNKRALDIFPQTMNEQMENAICPRNCNSCALLEFLQHVQGYVADALDEMPEQAGQNVTVETTVTDKPSIETFENLFHNYLQDSITRYRLLTRLRPWGGPAAHPRLRYIFK